MTTTAPIAWAPHPGPQTEFLASSAYEVLYGGAAGGGKSDALVALPLRWVHLPIYGITFRRVTPDLQPLIERAGKLYPKAAAQMGGESRFREHPYPRFRFTRSGALIRYGHLETEKAWESFQSQEIQVLCFDELTHFTETLYRNLIGRVRASDARLPLRIRAATNPGGVGHEWVFKRWGAWLDPEFDGLPARYEDGTRVPPARPGQILWVRLRAGVESYSTEPVEGATTRQFIPARLEDNPTLVASDPGYAERLLDNDPLRVRQLRFGDWLAKKGAGLMFKRDVFAVIDAPLPAARRVRCWDLAATSEPVTAAASKLRRSGNEAGPDYTAGAKYARLGDGTFCLEHVAREQTDDPWSLILRTAHDDGKDVAIGIEQEPGASGKMLAASMVSALVRLGFAAYVLPTSGSKVVRATPASATARRRLISIVRGTWNAAFLAEAEDFPDGPHDDQIDAFAHAHNLVTTMPVRKARNLDFLPPA